MITYEYACDLRDAADRTGNVSLYLAAADLFDLLQMDAAAERCRQRAAYYQEQRA